MTQDATHNKGPTGQSAASCAGPLCHEGRRAGMELSCSAHPIPSHLPVAMTTVHCHQLEEGAVVPLGNRKIGRGSGCVTTKTQRRSSGFPVSWTQVKMISYSFPEIPMVFTQNSFMPVLMAFLIKHVLLLWIIKLTALFATANVFGYRRQSKPWCFMDPSNQGMDNFN